MKNHKEEMEKFNTDNKELLDQERQIKKKY